MHAPDFFLLYVLHFYYKADLLVLALHDDVAAAFAGLCIVETRRFAQALSSASRKPW